MSNKNPNASLDVINRYEVEECKSLKFKNKILIFDF